MKSKKIAVVLLILCGVVAVAGIWWVHHHAAVAESPASAAGAAAPDADAVSALIKTQKIEQQPVESSLLAFGDVLSAKTDTLSFPQAGQITVLEVRAGQQVKRGQTLARLNTDPAALAGYQQAVSALNFARAELHREQELFDLKLLTQTQLETAQKQLSDAEATVASQQKLGGVTEAAQLIAPVDGVITALVVAQGDRLAAGSAVVQIGEAGQLRIQLGIEPALRHLVKAGMQVDLAPIQNPAQSVRAKIAEIQTVIDPKTQLVDAIVLLPASASGTLVAGMHVQGTVRLGQQQAWLVPRLAVLSDEKGSYIFQVAAGKARRVAVRTVSETATQCGIVGEIEAALPLVVLGNYELENGMAVRENGQ